MKLAAIPTETFNLIVSDLRSEGWKTVEEYGGFDAWIDYGLIVLARGGTSLRFEWDNWMEGSVDGSDQMIQEIRSRYNLK